ncbi:phosphohistidine phosphatase SixA [Psychrobacter sp. I-STPA6b]|uniref:phosphohistidine phosphatase SixA n=1 Tax=Psychrobacter sp. I-STPA6b TaxID=2585718 RepID=UPI001D0CC9BF|nr:phosphohistidine phosphatase SixA [Psychrobacter sp. I-STPA6b]
MKLILVRHGQAEDYQQNDKTRQLTAFGQQQAQQTAQYIMQKYQPDLFIVSPYDRAQQTLAKFTQLAPEVEIQTYADITPADNAMSALRHLGDVSAECVLVVCHMPIVAKMAALVTATHAESYALAEARVFEMEILAADMGQEIDRFVPTQP